MLLRISLAFSMAAIVFAGNADAGSVLADGYTEFSLGNSTRSGDSLGAVAVGGTANFNGFSVNSSPGSYTQPTYALLVGGTLANNGNNTNGVNSGGNASYNAITGGSLYFNGGGHATQQASPINFAAEQSSLTSLSSSLSGLANSNGTYSNNGYGNITLSGTGTAGSTEVFNLNGSTLFAQNPSQQQYNLYLNATNNATVIINVSGNNLSLSDFTTYISGTNASNVLYNFYQATGSTSNYGLSLTSDQIDGTILAPGAFVNTSYGQLHGQIIDHELDGTIETHTDIAPFDGNLPSAVPEPSSVLMVLTACVVGLLPVARRRLRVLTI